jgi:hypothetical protein
VLSKMSSIHNMFFILTKKWQPWTLGYTLVLQTMSSPLSCYFGSGPIGFPSKVMSCKVNLNLICLGPRSLSKDFGTNLKLFLNKTAWFHCTLLVGALSNVALSFMVWFSYQFKLQKVLELGFKWQESKHETLRFNNCKLRNLPTWFKHL